MVRFAVTLTLYMLVLVSVIGCGGGGGSAPSVAPYSPQQAPSQYSYEGINGQGQILANKLDQSGQATGVVVLNSDGSTIDLSSSIPADTNLSAITDSGYILGSNQSGIYVWDLSGGRQQLEEPDALGNIIDYWPEAVNNAGMVAGVEYYGDHALPVRWDHSGHVTMLPLPDGYDSGQAMDVNDAGLVAGYVTTALVDHLPAKAVIWDQDGDVRYLAPNEEADHGAMLINNAGEVAGVVGRQVVVWGLDGQVRQRFRRVVSSNIPQLYDMNDSGTIVGNVYCDDYGNTKAVVWGADGAVRLLRALPGYTYTGAWRISGAGAVIGYCSTDDSAKSVSVRWAPN